MNYNSCFTFNRSVRRPTCQLHARRRRATRPLDMHALRFSRARARNRAQNLGNRAHARRSSQVARCDCLTAGPDANHRAIQGSMFLPIAPSNGPQGTPKHMNAGTGPAEPAGAAIVFDDGPSAPLHGQRMKTQPKGDTGKRRPTPARQVAVALSACKGRLITTAHGRARIALR